MFSNYIPIEIAPDNLTATMSGYSPQILSTPIIFGRPYGISQIYMILTI